MLLSIIIPHLQPGGAHSRMPAVLCGTSSCGGLAKRNVDSGGNDEQIQHVSQYFSMIPRQIEGQPTNAPI